MMVQRGGISFTVIVGVAVLMATASGCSGTPSARAAEGPAPAVVPVRLAPVGRGELQRRVRGSGTLHLKSEAALAFKVGGVVTRVLVDAGARVRKGQLLAAVDATEAEAARSQLAEAAVKAERDLLRVQNLHESGAVGPVDVQNAQTAASVARAALDAARFNLRHTQLLAPDAGVIERRLVEVGEIASPGRPVFQMRGVSRGVVVRAQLVDRDALEVQVGDGARVRLDARPEHVFTGQVAQIASSASAGTGTIEVELQLEAGEVLQLPSGLTAKVEIACSERSLASVPLAALVDGDGSTAAVYVVEGDRAKKVPVRVSFFSDDRAALAAGLEQVDSVVALGANQLEDGSLVRVTH